MKISLAKVAKKDNIRCRGEVNKKKEQMENAGKLEKSFENVKKELTFVKRTRVSLCFFYLLVIKCPFSRKYRSKLVVKRATVEEMIRFGKLPDNK